ncbi:EamA family transporter RarD [bacterium]|nr:EamA family transporter RarD [bacterium]
MEETEQARARKGVIAILAACTIWGFAAIFYRQLTHIPPFDVMMHRMFWSLVFFGLLLAFQNRLGDVRDLVTDRKQIGRVAFGALVISVNWFLFIYAIFIDKLSESSLGYYISPLISVLIGLVVFREQLPRLKMASVALATLAVLILTFGLGTLPWISLVLALTFAIYGALKKTLRVDSSVSVTAEVLLMSPFILFWLVFFSETPVRFDGTLVLLMLSGPLTAGPLVLFSYAAQRIRLATLGILNYWNPTLQFFVALLIFGEPMSVWHGIAFPMIWGALALYSWASLTEARKPSTKAATDGVT